MPTQIIFSEANNIEVEEDPEFVSDAIAAADGGTGQIVLTRRGEKRKVYVNAIAIAYLQPAPDRRNKPRLNSWDAPGGLGT